MMDWRETVKGGFNWNFADQVINKLVSFGFGIFLVRLLYPQDYGLIAMAAVFLGFAEIFKDFGISSAIIQRKEMTADELNSSFWLAGLMGLLLSAFLVLSASPIASYYHESVLVIVIKVLAMNLFLSSFGLVHMALLVKALDFRSIFLISVTAEVVSSSIAIFAALAGWGVWSLLIKLLSRNCLQLVFLWGASSWRPRFRFSKEDLRAMMDFILPLVGTQSMNYWVRHLDNLLIGKFHGEQALGLYDRSYAFLMLPLGQIRGIVGKVALPVFARIQMDIVRVRKYFLKMTRLVALFSFPLMSGLYLVSNDLVVVVLGEKWISVTEPLKIFALTGFVQSVVTLIGILFVSQGKTKLQFNLGIFTSFVGIISILVGLNWGIVGVAWALLVATLINLGPNIYYAGHIIDMNVIHWISNLQGVFCCTLIMVFGLSLIEYLIVIEVTWLRLLTLPLIGALFYGSSLHLLRIQAYKELRALFSTVVYG